MTEDVVPASPRSQRNEAEIEQALTMLAFFSGNGRRAERELAAMGLEIDHSTLYRWKQRYGEKYEQIQRTILPKLRSDAAERHSQLADVGMEVEAEMLQRLKTRIKDLQPRDLSTAARNTAVEVGIHRTKAAELRGESPAPQVTLKLEDILVSLQAKGARVVNREEAGRLQARGELPPARSED